MSSIFASFTIAANTRSELTLGHLNRAQACWSYTCGPRFEVITAWNSNKKLLCVSDLV